MSKIIPVILSGGAGTRLWPLSTQARPKQFHPLAGSETLLQATARRVMAFDAPVVVTGDKHADEVVAQLEAVSAAPAKLILEPMGRNTAPAIALAALEADPGDLLLVLPSDQVIADVDAFHAAVNRAATLAEAGWLVTFGIRPKGPETGYGYIRRGERLSPGAYAVAEFVEKPDMATAERYLAEGSYEWNGGIFLFRAQSYLEALGRHAPDVLEPVRAAAAGARREGNAVHPEAGRFAQAYSLSIDYAVMEKADRVAVVPVAMGWSDIGSWDALLDIADKDADDVARVGNVLSIDSRRSLIRSEGPLVVTIGVADLIVVATEHAILVLPRGESQRTREAVEALAARKPD